ncbi:MAG: asparagine synthase (glutamine-hydrolyzing) [Phycisphaerales bacterium]
MCGIAGIVSLDGRPANPWALKRMCDTIAHRGPDDAGYVFFVPGARRDGQGGSWSTFADPAFKHINEHLPVFGSSYCERELADSDYLLALGHRRLAILDLTPYGHQPMSTSDRRFWIAHNGEIYNFPDLRRHLESKGYQFRTRTDTEVILYLWQEFGIKCLAMLDGMFAIALYDRLENRLTLARDRFGVKPLYYAVVDGLLVFASESKALFAGGGVRAELLPAALVEYFTFQNNFGRQTIWKDVQILGSGESLSVRPGATDEPSISAYFTLATEFDTTIDDEGKIAPRVSTAFGQAVKRQLISDVPVGSYLSGGMDSGSIVAVAAQSIPRLYTFTGGFDLTNVNGIEQGFDERRLAEQLSYLLQTEHYDVVLHAGDMPAAMERLTWHMDDPRVGMCHQTWYVAKLASKFVKVCLAGTGGDELFGGYPWRYRPAVATEDVEAFDDAMFRGWHRLLPPDELSNLFSEDLREYSSWPRDRFDEVMGAAPAWQDNASTAENLLQRALYFEYSTFLHGLLVTDDHISMAHSLETRVPFLDNALADEAWRIRPSLKFRMPPRPTVSRDGYIDSADGKYILRRAMENFLPPEFLHQKKQGFSPPDENWYRGPSMDYIKAILFDRRTVERPWFDQAFVRARLDDHFEGRRNHRLLIWSLLSVEWVQRHFVDTAPRPSPSSRGLMEVVV